MCKSDADLHTKFLRQINVIQGVIDKNRKKISNIVENAAQPKREAPIVTRSPVFYESTVLENSNTLKFQLQEP